MRYCRNAWDVESNGKPCRLIELRGSGNDHRAAGRYLRKKPNFQGWCMMNGKPVQTVRPIFGPVFQTVFHPVIVK
jgi:hypothetical protein